MTESSELVQQVTDAFATGTGLNIHAGGSKTFMLGANAEATISHTGQAAPIATESLELGRYNGVIAYEPTELVITAKCGTPIREIAELLDNEDQELAFDPPVYSGNDTLGGVVATAASGPSRVYRGGVRDYILGTSLINGRGELLRFGGTVMKNVAGYDVSRLQVGARGALGVLLDLSVKVLPKNESQATTRFSYTRETVREALRVLERKPLPLNGAAIVPQGNDETSLVVRFSGSDAAVQRALRDIGGDVMMESDAESFWTSLRDLEHPLFHGIKQSTAETHTSDSLWRFALPADAPINEFLNELPDIPDRNWLFDWGGRLRWVRAAADHSTMQTIASRFNGRVSELAQLSKTLSAGKADAADNPGCADDNLKALNLINQRIKNSFDPAGILNPGQWSFEVGSQDTAQSHVMSESNVVAGPAVT